MTGKEFATINVGKRIKVNNKLAGENYEAIVIGYHSNIIDAVAIRLVGENDFGYNFAASNDIIFINGSENLYNKDESDWLFLDERVNIIICEVNISKNEIKELINRLEL